jgi:hypothetical protein
VISRFLQGAERSLTASIPIEEVKQVQRWFSFLLLAGITLFVGLGSAAATASKSKPKVRSTLHGKTVLPHRIHWLAFPSVPRSDVKEIAFLIDARVKWIERNAPYSYSDDDGYLVTSWLTPGRHRFTVRLKTYGGRTAEDSVVARVLPEPDPPAALAGTWQRPVDTSNYEGNGPLPSGTYTLRFEKRWIQSPNPGKFAKGNGPTASIHTGAGWVFDYDWTPGPTQFHVQGAVTFRIFNEGPFGDAEGGSRCNMGGPGADYRWSVSDNKLTLAPVATDRCAERGFIWTGEWSRVA